MRKSEPDLSRRKLLAAALKGTGLFLLAGCENPFDALHRNQRVVSVLESVEGLNRRFLRLLTGRGKLAREFADEDISRYFKPNGNPPPFTVDYMINAASGWMTWRLQVAGLVEAPQAFSLEELKAMPARSQVTRHDCVEGWSAIARWKGVPLTQIVSRVRPKPEAKYVVFYCMDTDSNGNHYYESIDLYDATHPQTILAYEMNRQPLPVEYGAPIRLRVETQLGYKMAKYIERVEFVSSLSPIMKGRGGYWEDQGYEWYAGI
jgi:DMSO/TMAO reductase YedYZ molybdopterin-dependent catalytic subunit